MQMERHTCWASRFLALWIRWSRYSLSPHKGTSSTSLFFSICSLNTKVFTTISLRASHRCWRSVHSLSPGFEMRNVKANMSGAEIWHYYKSYYYLGWARNGLSRCRFLTLVLENPLSCRQDKTVYFTKINILNLLNTPWDFVLAIICECSSTAGGAIIFSWQFPLLKVMQI